MDGREPAGRPSFFRKPLPAGSPAPHRSVAPPPAVPTPPAAPPPPAPPFPPHRSEDPPVPPAETWRRPIFHGTGGTPLRHPRRQHAADDRHARRLLLLGARPACGVTSSARPRSRADRFAYHGTRAGAAPGHAQGGRRLRGADLRAQHHPGRAGRAGAPEGRGRGALGRLALRALPGRDGRRAPLPAGPDLVARHPLLVPGARRGSWSRSSSWAASSPGSPSGSTTRSSW